MSKKTIILAAIVASTAGQSLYAIHQGATEDGHLLPYARKMEHPLDAPVVAANPNSSFLMNLGPTGIRADIRPEYPKEFKVKFVFQDSKSPAKGLIKAGDHIIGANGKEFKVEHKFHRKQGGRGWPGPPFELAQAIEDSQGKDGKLTLIVLQGGSKNKRKNVTLQLKPVGRFAATWPWNCPRSDKLRTQLVDFLLENTGKGRIHIRAQHALALYASGDKRAIPVFKALGESLAKGRPEPSATGMCTWGWGYTGIFLGEYYNIYKDKSVKPAVDALNNCYEIGMDYASGGFSHRPYPAIQRRIADGGPKGYGSMAGPGGLSMVAQSIFKAAGLPISDRAYNRTHQAYLAGPGQNESGTLAYGFGGGWGGTQIRLKSATGPCKSKEGVGYLCPTGLKNAGDFEVEDWFEKDGKWDKKMVAPTGKYSWLKSEANKLLVYESGYYLENKGIQQRRVFRPNILPEPNSAYSNNRKGGGHNAPVGMGALAHFIGNKGNKSWNYLGEHMAIGCAASPTTLWDGHASGEMHAFWGALGSFRAPEKDLRSFLDYTKTWIILSESHDGQGLIDQPFGCQRNATCSISLNRTAYTHVALLILSVPNRNLLITGADYAQPAGPTTARAHTSSSSSSSSTRIATKPTVTRAPQPPARQPRKLSPDRRAILDRSLQATLVKLSEGNELKPVPINISKTRAKIWLAKAESGGNLTFQVMGRSDKANFKWDDLTSTDHAMLSRLVSTIKSSSKDAQAMTGVYMESAGHLGEADKYYSSAGDASTRKLAKLFD